MKKTHQDRKNKVIKKNDTILNLEIKPGNKHNATLIYQATVLLAFIILGFLIYSNTLKSPFIFDDRVHIQENSHIQLTELNFKHIIAAGLKSPLPQRLIANISFALNYYFHQYDVVGYHLTNIIIHIVSAIFLYLFVKNTLRTPLLHQKYKYHNWIAFFTAALWLVHPIQTQSVTYIVQRMTSLAAMFYILSFLLYLKGRLAVLERKKSWPWFVGCIFSGLLAITSKEIAATLPAFILLYEWYFFQKLNITWLRKHIQHAAVIAIFIVFLGVLSLNISPLEKISKEYDFTMTERLLTQPRVIIHYITLLFLPHPNRLNLDHDFALSHSLVNPPTTILCIGIIIGLLGLAIYKAKKKPLLSFCILWFFGNLLIESSFIKLELIYEHRLYLPSMFVSLAVVVLLSRMVKANWARIVLFCIVTLLFCIWTYERNKVWANPVTLWQDCADKSPKKPRPNYNLANNLLDQGNTSQAIKYYTKTLKLDPNYSDAHFGMGAVLLDENKIDQAIEHFTDAFQINPKDAKAHYNIGIAFHRQNKLDKALSHYNQALQIDPKLYQTYRNLGALFYRQEKFDKAIAYWTKTIQMEPDVASFRNLGIAYYRQGRFNKAITYWTEALQLKPDWPEMLNNLAWFMATHKDTEYHNPAKALQQAKHACELTEYKSPELLDTLAVAYASTGKFPQAIEASEKAIKIAISTNKKYIADQIQTRLKLYKTSQPYYEPPKIDENIFQADKTATSPQQTFHN